MDNDVITRNVLKEELNDFGLELFKYLDKRFSEVEARFEKIEANFDRLQQTLDHFLKRLDDIEADNHARDLKLARLESWAEKVAAKTGIKLEY